MNFEGERFHPLIGAAIYKHQLFPARVESLHPEVAAQDDALHVARLVERDAGHHGAASVPDFQLQAVAAAVERQGRSGVGRHAERGDGGDQKEHACEKGHTSLCSR